MKTVKMRNLQIIKIGIIFLIFLLFIVYYISSSLIWKGFSVGKEFEYTPVDLGSDDIRSLTHLLKKSKSGVFHGEKLIHLDLKGAPPLLSFLKEFIPFVKKLGATGLLIEYEDMFFYRDELEDIRATNAYQPSVLKEIIALADLNNLIIVPLIQTFGHLEFVLKLDKYKDLREVKEYPQAVCPSHERTLFTIKEMIDQMLEAHPKAKYIHIGCDEVMDLGQCPRCRSVMRNKFWTTGELYLNHVKNVAEYINKTYPGVRPIIWGDMIGKFNERILIKSGISSLVDLMIWKYVPNVSDDITEGLLDMYSRVFKTIWIASAFKGATGPKQITTDITYHLANHAAWLKIVGEWKNKLNFKGIAVTGWQRYDHFAELCELLPVAMPSLAYCLNYFNTPEPGINETEIVQNLQCDVPYETSVFKLKYLAEAANCHFPGFLVYGLVGKFHVLSTEIKDHFSVVSSGWFSVYHVLHKFSSPAYVKRFFKKWSFKEHLQELKELEEKLKYALSEIYDEFTVDEWITSNFVPLRVRLEVICRAQEILLEQEVWPRRPLLNTTYNFERFASEICSLDKSFGCALLLI